MVMNSTAFIIGDPVPVTHGPRDNCDASVTSRDGLTLTPAILLGTFLASWETSEMLDNP